MNNSDKVTGYVWYNPDMGLYQKGTHEEYQGFLQLSGMKQEFSLILKLTNHSDILAYKIVRQLNDAKAELMKKGRYAV